MLTNMMTSMQSEECVEYKKRSHSVQGLASISSPMKIPLPPRMWITDVEDESSDEMNGSVREDGACPIERPRVRSRFRHHKQRTSVSVPVGIFWDIENCQVPRGCSAIDVVAAIRAKFLIGRREADFVVVCDVRKEAANRLQELNDAQISLIHVCGTQKNAADEKLRQCMRRFGELHTAPASLVLISGDINFAADLSDFRHRKNMEVILVHKQNTSSALVACASTHYCYNELIAHVPRNPKVSQTEEEEEATCEMEVTNLPMEQPPERVSRRLRRLADNCGGKVLRVTCSTALLRFPTADHASRALKRMDGEDVFGRKIGTRFARSGSQAPAYSSDEGYSTAPAQPRPPPQFLHHVTQVTQVPGTVVADRNQSMTDWTLALRQLPAPTPPPLEFCPPLAPKPRKIRGTHGSSNSVVMDQSGCSSSNSGDDGHGASLSHSRAASPWNSSASFSEHSEADLETAELTVANLPSFDPARLERMLTSLFSQHVPVVRVSVWNGGEGPLATVVLRSEWDARLAISRVHKRRLEYPWAGRRLELSLGNPSPAPNLDVLKARLKAILLEQPNFTLPLLRLRDAYASRHCCALTTSDISKLKNTVVIHERYGRMVQLVDLTPLPSSFSESEETPWKCQIHSIIHTAHEDGTQIMLPVYIEIAVLARNTQILLRNHGGILPLLSFVECYEATFQRLVVDGERGVALELLLRSVPGAEVRETPSRHLAWRAPAADSPPLHAPHMSHSALSETSRSSVDRERFRTAPALEPILALFEREIIDLLRTLPRCTVPFSRLIPAYHHHFGRQCRVADYGFTKLPDLLAALGNTIVILGSGSYRVITISAAAQARRWTSDLLKILKSQPRATIHPRDIPGLYESIIGQAFTTINYGVCTMEELMDKVIPPNAIIRNKDGTISLPRKVPTPEERARTIQFAAETIELLCFTPNLRIEFTKFVTAYHTHFGRKLRVAHYGCVRLVELFELIPDAATVYCELSGERGVRMALPAARAVMAQRLKSIAPVAFSTFAVSYANQFKAQPFPDILEVATVEELVIASGGYLEGGVVYVKDSPRWVNGALAACAVLSFDRSVARASSEDYFVSAYRGICGTDPNVSALVSSRVVEVSERLVRLTMDWRMVWRVAQIMAALDKPLSPMEIYAEYSKLYGSLFDNAEQGLGEVIKFLQSHAEVFHEERGAWQLRAGVALPRAPPRRRALEDYSLHDTPPGQKGSRVFESPRNNIWCSPPASALPAPTALLAHENRRRTRLAAQFEAA